MHRDTGCHSHGLPPFHDDVALNEIELYGEVLIAVAGTDEPLSPTELDRALGLSPEPGEPERKTPTGPAPTPPPPAPRTEPHPVAPHLPPRVDPPADGAPPITGATAEPSLSPYVLPPPPIPPRALRLG